MNGAAQPRDLDALAAYERWAETYPPTAHNPLMRVEQRVMLESLPDVQGACVLDLACGSGRYTRLALERGASRVVAADFSPAMLRKVTGASRVRAGLTSLPFATRTFDLVVSGLAVGHASDLQTCLRESARVLKNSGVLLYSDFHPEAARAGLTRSFKDVDGVTCTVPSNHYDVAAHRTAAATAGFEIEVVHELRVGTDLREEFAGCEEFYRRCAGLALVLVVRARRIR
jgi:malonyl-CoA O-methyltransferase